MYQLMKLQMLFGFALNLLKDLRLKYIDGKLTVIEMEEILPFIADITDFSEDLVKAKEMYTKLPNVQKGILHDQLATNLNLPVTKIEPLINELFQLIQTSRSIFAILAKVIPAADLNTDNDVPEK